MKKGFTLIELLAVIIILAIVATFATPVILDVIDDARNAANLQTFNNILTAGEYYYSESLLDSDRKYNIDNLNNIYDIVAITGKKPDNGNLYVNSAGYVAASMIIDQKCYVKDFYDDTKVYEDGENDCNLGYVGVDTKAPTVEFVYNGTIGTNEWYKSDVILNINTNDFDESGVKVLKWCIGRDCTPNNIEEITTKELLITDSVQTQICAEAVDYALNTSNKVCSKVFKVDRTAPGFVGVADKTVAKNDIVDLNEGVSVTDSTSGLVGPYTCDIDGESCNTLDTTKAGLTIVKYEAIDNAGNITTIYRKIKVEADAPVITYIPEANAINTNGWANRDFYVEISVTDNSGLGLKEFRICTANNTCDPENGSVITDSTTATRLISTDSNSNRICVEATDNDNKKSGVICSDVFRLDKNAPTAGSITISGSKGNNDWYVSDTNFTLNDGSDALSGHLSTTVNLNSITSNTNSTIVTVTTTDLAGNSSTNNYEIKVDKTRPTIAYDIKNIDGTNGWYKTKVNVKGTASDDTSGIQKIKWCLGTNCSATNELLDSVKEIELADTNGTQICMIGIDVAGNSSNKICTDTIKIDTVKPNFKGIADATISKGQSFDLDSGVTVSDETSGVTTFSYSPLSFDNNKAGRNEIIYTAIDNAGNEAVPITRVITVSTTAPNITYQPQDKINSYGWAHEDFYVNISAIDNSGHGIKELKICTSTTNVCNPDNGSLVSGSTATRLISTNSNSNRICVKATDNYNQTSETVCSDTLLLDKVIPTAGTVNLTGTIGTNGYYRSDVTATAIDGTDDLSGHLSSTVSPNVINFNTTGTDVVVTTKDKAGNTSSNTYVVRIDKEYPTATITSTNTVSSNQTATLSMADNYGVVAYYFGKTNPDSNVVTYASITSTTSTSITSNISSEGIYYLSVKDIAGNTTTINKTFYKTTFALEHASVSPISVITLSGKSFILPTPTAYTGYNVSTSWFNGSTSVGTYGSNYIPTGNVTLTTTIIANTYAVNFNANGGTGAPSSQTKTHDINLTLSSTIPTRSGYEFMGWGSSSSDTSVDYAKGANYTFNGGTTLYAIWRKKVTITFVANGATLSKSSDYCYMYNADASCSITSPTITRSQYTIIGFNTSSSGTTSAWNQNTAGSVSNDGTYNAITSMTLAVTFNKNTASSIAATSKSCTIYNTTTSCNVTTPVITAQSNFTVQGYGDNSGATQAVISSNANLTLTTTNNGKTYYALNSRTLSWNFNKGATSSINATSKTCTIWNTSGTCGITTPTITPVSGYTQNGFGSSGATQATVAQNTTMTISNSSTGGTYYALQYRTLSFNFNKNTASSISATSKTCTVYNATTSCSVTTPSITPNSGYIQAGWGTGTGSTSATVAQNATLTISNSTTGGTYYAITKLVTLSLGYTSGSLYTGENTNNVTISGSNYGTLSCTTNSSSVATCSISGSTLVIKSGSSSGTATITLKESNLNKTATYTIYVSYPSYAATPEYYCSSGDGSPSGTTCYHTTTTSASTGYNYSCPSGYTSSGSGSGMTCSKSSTQTTSPTSSTSYSCPSGYTKSGSGSSTTCSKSSTQTASPSSSKKCSESGYTYNGNVCFKFIGNPSCPSGYSLSSNMLSCYRSVSPLPCGSSTSVCPSGTSCCYTASSYCSSGHQDTYQGQSGCYYYGTVVTSYTCPSGYTASGSGSSTTCSKTTTQTTSPSSSTSYSCPSGYSSSGSGSSMTCSKTTTQTTSPNSSPYSYCSSGTLYGSYCYSTSTYTAYLRYTCPSGGTVSGSTCYR